MSLNTKYAKLLYEEMLNDVTKNPDEWINFLNTATWLFEYNFSEQLLIYAQRPNAKAVATMEFWNEGRQPEVHLLWGDALHRYRHNLI